MINSRAKGQRSRIRLEDQDAPVLRELQSLLRFVPNAAERSNLVFPWPGLPFPDPPEAGSAYDVVKVARMFVADHQQGVAGDAVPALGLVDVSAGDKIPYRL